MTHLLNADYLILDTEESLTNLRRWQFTKWSFQMKLWLSRVILYFLFNKSLPDNFIYDLIISPI